MNPALPTYVLITPARNEEAFIELTLKKQTVETKAASNPTLIIEQATRLELSAGIAMPAPGFINSG